MYVDRPKINCKKPIPIALQTKTWIFSEQHSQLMNEYNSLCIYDFECAWIFLSTNYKSWVPVFGHISCTPQIQATRETRICIWTFNVLSLKDFVLHWILFVVNLFAGYFREYFLFVFPVWLYRTTDLSTFQNMYYIHYPLFRSLFALFPFLPFFNFKLSSGNCNRLRCFFTYYRIKWIRNGTLVKFLAKTDEGKKYKRTRMGRIRAFKAV